MLVKTLVSKLDVPAGTVGTVQYTGEFINGVVWYDVVFYFYDCTLRYTQEELEPVDG